MFPKDDDSELQIGRQAKELLVVLAIAGFSYENACRVLDAMADIIGRHDDVSFKALAGGARLKPITMPDTFEAFRKNMEHESNANDQ